MKSLQSELEGQKKTAASLKQDGRASTIWLARTWTEEEKKKAMTTATLRRRRRRSLQPDIQQTVVNKRHLSLSFFKMYESPGNTLRFGRGLALQKKGGSEYALRDPIRSGRDSHDSMCYELSAR
jgi:hypothetical protein